MVFSDENELINYGKKIGKSLKAPAVIELVGDVGAGKTTFVRGIAEGLGVKEPITSPSFTISKRYAFSKDAATNYLVHYDFYRLADPGLMSDDLAETIADPRTVVILEWADTVADILPASHITFKITINDDGSRNIETENL